MTDMRQKTAKYKNITRVDHPKSRTHGYNVRIMWQDERRSKFFSDGKYGGQPGALAAAIEWRDATEKELGKPRTERHVVGIFYSPSEYVGIRRMRDGKREYYQATWPTHVGKQRRAQFSITKYGEEQALALARKAREQGEREFMRIPASPEE